MATNTITSQRFFAGFSSDLSFTLGMNCGILIGVPIPTEHSEDGDLIERAIQQAMIEHE